MSVRTSPKSAVSILLSAFVVTAVNYAAPPGGSLGTGEVLVNSAVNAQLNPAIARDADGDYVVAWQSDVSVAGDGSDVDIYLQRYSHNGAAQGGAVRVNTTLSGVQQTPAVAMDASGNFVVVWDSDQAETPADGTTGIWGQRFDNTGAVQGGEFQVNTYTTNLQAQPAVAMSADGAFVVAWQSLLQDGSGQGVFAQRFDNTGAAAGSEFRVNTFVTNSQTLPGVAMTPAGAFVITWQSNNQAGGGLLNDIYAQRYLAEGTASGGELHVNATTAGEQRAPRVGIAHDGAYAVAWESADAGGTGIFARVIDGVDTPATGEIAINTTTAGEQTAPSVAVDASGDFVVAWQGPDASGMGVWFQRVDATGTLQGAETAANATTTTSQQDPAVAADADGDYVVAWESDQVALSGFDIYARRFSGPEDVDLSLTKTDSPDPVVSGSALTYTINVTNNHAVASTTGVAGVDAAIGSANGIVVTDTLPAGRTANSASGTGWTCSGVGTGTVTCSYGPVLAAGATTSNLVIAITTAVTPGEITNTATVVANQSDTVSANNTATQKTASCTLTATPGTVQLSSATYSAGENAGTATISATRTGGLCGSVSVSYGTANGTAAAGSDYTAASGTLTWAENDNANKTFSVPITSDSVDEPNETVALVLSNADRATLGTQNTATLTINDDDAVTVSFSAAAQTVDENVGTVTVTATRTGATTFDISVPFTIGGTATGTDHGATSDTIVILAGSASASYTFAVGDDVLDEANETVIFTMGSPSGGNVTGAAPTTHTVTITDNDDTPTVNFNPIAETLTEGNSGMRGVTVTAELNAVSGRAVTVPFTVSGTATDVGEHTAANGTITINAGSLTGTTSFFVNGDTRHEDDETIILTMATPGNAVAGTDTVHTTTIEDDDNAPGVTLEVSGTPFAESPSGVATVTARLDAVSGKETVVHLAPAFGGTATLTTDYTRSGTDITIPAGSTTGTITLAGVADTLDETNETVIVDIDTVDNGTEAPVMQQVTATITDDDNAPNVTLSVTGSPLAEEAGVATVSATLSAASAKDTTITLAFSGTATGATDYSASGTTLVIPAGSTTPTTPVTVTGVGDALDEANETIVVDMSCDANCTEATTQQVTATITDNDAVTVQFAADQAVGENAGMVTVTVTRTGASTFPVQVPFTLSGNAANPADHGAANGTITVPASASATETGSYTFTLADDARDEVDETLTFTMGTPTGGSVTATAPTTHTVTITDNDAVTVSFSVATQNPGEAAGTVTVTATRTGVTDFAISVPFTVTGSAANPADHNAADGTISIPASPTTSGTYAFTVANDTIDENDETVVFTMGAPTGGTVTAAAPSVQTVTITDNDTPPTVQFTAASQSVAEDVSGGTATVTLQLSAASGLDVTVQYGVTAGNATNGTDYTLSPATPGPVLIPAGQTTATITVTVNNDGTDEPNETSTLTLTSPSNATLGTTTGHVLTILDNDDVPQVSFTASGQTKTEADGSAQITVQLSRPSSEDVNVPFTISGTSGASDRTVDSSPVTIIAGDTAAVINVSINNDALDENTETTVLTLGTPTNATSSGTTVHTLSIADNDTASLSVAAAASAAEGSNTTFAISLSTASDRDLAVTYSTANGTATSGSDYAGASGAIVTIPAGATTGSIAVATTADALDEPDETFTVTLTGVDNGAQISSGAASGTGTITDDDPAPGVALSLTGSPLAENGGAATVAATLTAVSGRVVTVNLAYTGTAAGTDYTASTASIVIPAGSMTGSATLTAVSDSIDEANETVIVDISSVTNGTETGTQQVTATIADDDAAPGVTLSLAGSPLAENGGAATVTATLSAPSSQTVTVNLAYTGTAAAADYTASAASIVVAAGSTTGTATITGINDAIDEADETVIVDIASVGNGSETGTQQVTATVTDDDAAPTVTLSSSAPTMAETGGTATLTATLSAASSQLVTVNLGFSGTATGTADYTASAAAITIAAGATTGSVTLSSVSDGSNEPNETVITDITSVTNGTESGVQTQTVSITDDDSGGGGGGGGSFGWMSLWLLVPALARRRRISAH